MMDTENPDNLEQDIEHAESLDKELAFLFGEETVQLARQLDVTDLDLTDEITKAIAAGIKQLKKLRANPDAQVKLTHDMEQGTRLLLCMWIIDMDLLDKIQTRSYIDRG